MDYRPTAVCLHPHMSFTGFQHQVMIGTKSGELMKWNANVNPGTLKHETKYRLYGQLYGESKVAQDIPFPGNRLDQLSATLPKGVDQ